MNFSLKPNPLIAIWIPGFTVLFFILKLFPEFIPPTLHYDKFVLSIGLLAVIALSFVIGEILDVVRDLLESCLDRYKKIEWDFFFEGDKEKLANLEEWYYTWYEFDCNLFLAILLLVVSSFTSNVALPHIKTMRIVVGLLLILLAINIWLSRLEIKRLIDKWYEGNNPHG